MRLVSTLFALSTVLPLVANAQTAAEATPAVAPAAAEPATTPAPAAAVAAAAAPAPASAAPPPISFAWESLVDAYYLYNFTGDSSTQPPSLRQFDTTSNNFALNYAKLGVHADTDLVSFRLDFGGGHTASIINGSSLTSSAHSTAATATTPGTATDSASLYGNGFLIEQAFATVRVTPQFSIDAGKFVTSASAEVIESNKNWLYSRSLLFTGVPLLHTGLRLNYAAIGNLATPELVLSLQLVNGWNNDPDFGSDKTFGLNATYTPANQGLTVAATTYIGKEAGTDTWVLIDAVATKDIGSLSVGGNIDYLKTGTPYWFGIAAMARYTLSDSFNLAARAEFLNSSNGYALTPTTALDGNLYEFTGMGAWTVGKHYELRLEIRADISDQQVFIKGTTPEKNQVTGLLAALAYF
jgi:hypothetical protein